MFIKIFERTTIDTELLVRISRILNRNFFTLYTNERKLPY